MIEKVNLKEKMSLLALLHELEISFDVSGENYIIDSVSTFDTDGCTQNLQFTTELLQDKPTSITLAPVDSATYSNIVRVIEPKKVFFKIVEWLKRNVGFLPLFESKISRSSFVHDTAIVSDKVHIGDGSVIGPGVVLHENVKVGKNCIIEANSVLGTSGFGVIREEHKIWMMPHIGGVELADGVRIGSLTTVDRGTIGNTYIGENTKIDDRVHIAHNTKVGKRNIICGGSCVGGSVVVQDDCWLGLGCNIRQKVNIASGTEIGIGANIFHDTVQKSDMVGYPARKMPR